MKGHSHFLLLAMATAALVATTGAGCGGDATPGQDVLDDQGQPDDIIGNDTLPEDLTPTDSGMDKGPDAEPDITDIGPDGIDPEVVQDVPFEYPDAKLVNESRNSAVSVTDDPYLQKMTQFFMTNDVLPATDIRDIKRIDGGMAVGTPGGLLVKGDDESSFSLAWPLPVKALREPMDTTVRHFSDHDLDGRIVFVTSNHLVTINIESGDFDQWHVSGAELQAVVVTPSDGQIYLGRSDGLFRVDQAASAGQNEATLEQIPEVTEIDIRDLAASSIASQVFAATKDGLLMYEPGKELKTYTADNSGLPDSNVLSVAVCQSHLAVGTATGFAITGDRSIWTSRTTGIGQLAWGEVIDIACAEWGFVLGHEMGATALSQDFESSEYFYGLRWMADLVDNEGDSNELHLLGKRLPAVATGPQGQIWLGGPNGLSRIYREERTLAQKEVIFDGMVKHFWRMDGFFSSDGNTASPWDPMDEMRLHDKDNDGLWTQMMIGGWCFAYAATGDEKYYDYAHRAMENMYKLIDYPWVTFNEAGLERGFISRSIISQESDFIPCSGDWVNNGGSGGCPGPGEPCTVPCIDGKLNYYDYKVCCAEMVNKVDSEGVTHPTHLRWNPIEVDGKKYVWKADTSSDEIAGHAFGFPIYYDLCAKDDEERAKVASYVADLAGYIARNGMNLIDLDGTHTTFGIFGPDTVGIAVDGVDVCMENGHSLELCMGEFYGGAWLNSNEGIGLLLAAWHMTGDKFFYDTYENLITTHKYNKAMIPSEDTLTIVNPSIANHSDHELAMLAYTTVLRYEPNPERLAAWKDGFQFLYDWERPERNPWWAAVAALSGMPAPDAENARRTLRELPDDLREWLMDNCHRKDYKINPAKDRHGDRQFTSVPPYDEIRTFWWNGNPYDCSEGGDGRSWNAPTVFLLPYYMARYTGLITDVPSE